jgi:nicotinamidase-related amidase
MKSEIYITPDTLDARCDEWLAAIAECNFRERTPNPAAAALIVVDMQRIFLDEGMPLACENSRVVIPRVAGLVGAFRSAGRPVIFLQNVNKAVGVDRSRQLSEWWPTPPLEGTPEVGIHPDLAPLPEEKVIPKRRYGGFHGTDLDLTLRTMGIGDVVIAGVLTNVCPETTAREAFMHDYRVFFVADATAALTEEMHVASLRTLAGWFAKVVRSGEVIGALGARS